MSDNNNKTGLEEQEEEEESESVNALRNFVTNKQGMDNDTIGYRNLLLAFKHDAENEYKRIAEIVDDYQFKDHGVKKEVQKLLEATGKNNTRLDKELKKLDGDDNSGSSTKGEKNQH
jgi:hypothetical protein